MQNCSVLLLHKKRQNEDSYHQSLQNKFRTQHFYRKSQFWPVIKFVRKSISHLATHFPVLRRHPLCLIPKEELQPWPEQVTLSAISCISHTQNHQEVIRVTADFPVAWNLCSCIQRHTQTHIWVLLTWIIYRQTRYGYTYPFTQFPSGHFPGEIWEKIQKHLGDVVTRVILQSLQLLWAEALPWCLSLAVAILLQMPGPAPPTHGPAQGFVPKRCLMTRAGAVPVSPSCPTPAWGDGRTLPVRSSPDPLGTLPNNSWRS